MKKVYVVLAVLLSLGIMKAVAEDLRNVPGSGNNTSIPADYGGVDVATNSFVIGLTTVPTENGPRGWGYTKFSTTNVGGLPSQLRWTIYGVNWSTGSCGLDYVSIQVSSAGATQARELTRVFNTVGIATATATGTAAVCAGATPLRWPIRAYGNLFFGVNVGGTGMLGATGLNPYNQVDLLYYLESQ